MDFQGLEGRKGSLGLVDSPAFWESLGCPTERKARGENEASQEHSATLALRGRKELLAS